MSELSNHNTVVRLLKKTDEEQKSILRAFASIPLESKVIIMELNRDVFYPLKQENKDVPLPILSYVAMILAIEQYRDQTSGLDKNVIDVRAKSFRKQPKRDKLLGKWALVKLLKNDENLSFRQISNYLQKYHKLNVVHSTIYDLWNELEVTKNQGEK
ncbi:MAG: hypothetical protein WC272_05625 [Sulfurimonas sp.]